MIAALLPCLPGAEGTGQSKKHAQQHERAHRGRGEGGLGGEGGYSKV